MKGQRSMNCRRCGSTMTFRKFFDYGGHSWGWECISCKEIIDQIQKIYPSAKQVWNEKEKLGMGKGI